MQLKKYDILLLYYDTVLIGVTKARLSRCFIKSNKFCWIFVVR